MRLFCQKKRLSQKHADDADDTDLRRFCFLYVSNYQYYKIRENLHHPRHPRSKDLLRQPHETPYLRSDTVLFRSYPNSLFAEKPRT